VGSEMRLKAQDPARHAMPVQHTGRRSRRTASQQCQTTRRLGNGNDSTVTPCPPAWSPTSPAASAASFGLLSEYAGHRDDEEIGRTGVRKQRPREEGRYNA